MNINTKEDFKREVETALKRECLTDSKSATKEQMYFAVSKVIRDMANDDWYETEKKRKEQDAKMVYYLSMEFLIGRTLGNNIINMQKYDVVKEALDEMGFDINAIENEEPDPALGNGGLGRLAACFLDSLASLSYPAMGCGIRYHYGMFRQKIADGSQKEVPDEWLKNDYPFEVKRPEETVEVRFGGVIWNEYYNGENHFHHDKYNVVKAVPYDIPIVGYGNHVVNTLRIWDSKPSTNFNLDRFDKGEYDKSVEQANIARNISNVLYPNDNHEAGKELRLSQQYFFISASLQSAIKKYKQNHDDIRNLPEKVVFQMNDTHPTVAVPELMRILMDEENLGWDEAWDITTRCVAYTNHTIMSEALEKWPIPLFQKLLPRVYQIIEEINRRFENRIRERFGGDESRVARMAILRDGQIRMAYMAICAGFSVNGVAQIHTGILKNRELKDFCEMWPEKFNNKTNGVTQRRFLLHGNPLLANWITGKIGDGWITDFSQIKKLESFVDDPQAQEEFMKIKRDNKVRLAAFIKENNGIDIDVDSIFDVQVKRLHEYKRQLMNVLRIMHQYNYIKDHPEADIVPRTYIFGAKAAAGYKVAKEIIKLINAVADKINNDEAIGGRIKVVFIEEYNVSKAEIIFPASDVSEQISTASREASGTGNMKFMINGAVTVGTMDGAQVEMAEELGQENMFIFGMSAEEVMEHERNDDYDPMQIYNNDSDIRRVIDQLMDGTYANDFAAFRNILNSLLHNQGQRSDPFFILKDLRSYMEAQDRVDEVYKDRSRWARLAMLQTARSGRFSSDRTIEEYVRDIWNLDKLEM